MKPKVICSKYCLPHKKSIISMEFDFQLGYFLKGVYLRDLDLLYNLKSSGFTALVF